MSAIDDLRHAARALARSPMYAAVAILTLGLGIGATTVAFTVVGRVLLAPLPYAEPDRLVTVNSVLRGGDQPTPSYPDFADFHRQADVFDGFAFVTGSGVTFRRPGASEQILASMVTDEFFPLLRARPALGRLLTPDDNRSGASRAVVLSHAMWTNEFARDPAVIGKTLDLSVGQFTIVGVLAAGQAYPLWVPSTTGTVFIPLATVPYMMRGGMQNRGSHADARAIARLKPGVTRETAERQLRTIATSLAAAYPATDAGQSAALHPLREEIVGNIGPSFAVVSLAVVLVLLLACADVANLALVRATTREREIAVRTALGAGRARIVRALLSESLLLAVAGGVIGVILSVAGVRLFVSMAPEDIPRLDEIHVDVRALATAIGVTMLCAALCALAPIVVTARADLVPSLKSGGRGASGDRRGRRMRSAIVAAQIALSVVLIAGAGLLIKSFALLRRVDPGFDPRHLIVWSFQLTAARVGDASARIDLIRRVLAAVAVPGVQSVSVVNHAPAGGGGTFTPVGPDGRNPAADTVQAVYEIAAPNYFSTMRIPVLEGRAFTDADLTSGAVPSIVSATAAKRYWPGVDPVGRTMTVLNSVHSDVDFGKPIQTTVVGVVGDVKKFSLDEDPFPAVYLPITHPVPSGADIVIRTGPAPASLLAAIRRAASAVDPDLPVTGMDTAVALIDGGLARQQFIMTLLSIFSGVALVLAALGLYGVIAYSVTQRIPEFGIRMALGAAAHDITGVVARGVTAIVATGLAVGIGGALLLGHGMRSLLYGVTPTDPATLITVVGILVGVAALACYLPARRAARVDPVVALRSE